VLEGSGSAWTMPVWATTDALRDNGAVVDARR